MADNGAKYLPPFHSLMVMLKANGFLFGIDSYERVAAYWQMMEPEDELSIEKIGYHLSALLCRSAEQQLRFNDVFQQFLPKKLADGSEEITAQTIGTISDKSISTNDGEEEEGETLESTSTLRQPQPASDIAQKIKLAPVLPRLYFPEERLRVWNLAETATSLVPLQEKIWTETTIWDLPQSIRSIIRSGGFPKMVFRKRKQAPRYLVLIEQKNSKDHMAGYAAELVKEINSRDLEADYYFFDKDPAHCWKELREPTTHVNIELLKSEWNGARLLLVGQASSFINPETGAPSNLALDLPNDFPLIALLSTTPNLGWGTPERNLQHLMPVLPMSIAGLGKLMDAWNGVNLTSLEDWQMQQPELVPPKLLNNEHPVSNEAVMMELYRYLGDDAFKWLCACAVYPELYFQLTCILHDEAIPLGEDMSQWQQNERWNKALKLLSRLDWFRFGFMPRSLAKGLKQNLTAADRKLIDNEIRRVLALSNNKVDSQTYAADIREELLEWLDTRFKVLWVDDNPSNNSQFMEAWTKTFDIKFKIATTSSEAAKLLSIGRFDMVISDTGRQGEEHTGQVTLDIVAGRAPVVFFTNKRGLNLRNTLIRAGAMDVTDSVEVLQKLLQWEWQKKFGTEGGTAVFDIPDIPSENVVTQKKQAQKKAPKPDGQVLRDQEMLKQLGFYEGEVDGLANDALKGAIRDFQASVNLVADGIAGPQTRKAMEQALARRDSASQTTQFQAPDEPPSVKEKKVSKKQEILDLLANGETNKAIKELRAMMPEDSSILNLTTQYNRLEKDIQHGTISGQDANLRSNQIRHFLIEITQKLPGDTGNEAGVGNIDFDENSTYLYIEYASVNEEQAQSIAGYLEDSGIEAILDIKYMRSGEKIRAFIQRSMDVCEAAIFLISSVGLQSPTLVKSLDYLFGSEFSRKKFFCCALDMEFSNTAYLNKAMLEIEDKIKSLEVGNYSQSQSVYSNYENNVEEIKNYMEMRELLPKIINRLSHVQLIDISGNNFERGMREIVNFLRPPTSKRPVFK